MSKKLTTQQKAVEDIRAYFRKGDYAGCLDDIFQNAMCVRLASSPTFEVEQRNFNAAIERIRERTKDAPGAEVFYKDLDEAWHSYNGAVSAACEALVNFFVGFGVKRLCGQVGINLESQR